jgi:DNA-binding MarR family transcriptional regulator
MELAELSRRIAEEARRLEAEMESLRLVFDMYDPNSSTESIESALSRIEERLMQVHDHTGKLVERVPENLTPILAELREAVLVRIDSWKSHTTRLDKSTKSNESIRSAGAGGDWLGEALNNLTPQEKRLFQVCFECGLVTYRELAGRLGITPTSAKNIVNRLFQNTDKRALFRKEWTHGVAKVAVDETVQRQILKGRQKDSSAKEIRQVQRPLRR